MNAWGLAYAPGNPFWISNEGSGWSTLYDGMGNPQTLQVVVPAASGLGPGSPTGIVYNSSSEFAVEGWASIFLFATLDGTISGWAPRPHYQSYCDRPDVFKKIFCFGSLWSN